MGGRVGVVLVLASLRWSWAMAQVPAGGEFQVNSYTTGAQSYAAAATDANGDFVVVWRGSAQSAPGSDVFGQRYAASGAARGAEFRVNAFTTGSQGFPSVAAQATGRFVVAWEAYTVDGQGIDIFARRFDASGAPVGVEFRVNTYTTGTQNRTRVAVDAGGAFVVVWSSAGQDGSGPGVFGQRYDAAGVPRGGEFRVHDDPSGGQGYPSLASAAAGGFVVAWTGPGIDVFARRFDASGAPQGTEFRVNTHTTAFQGLPAVTSDDAGNFVVAWESAYQDGSGSGIFAQRYDASGAPQGTEFRVNTYTTGGQYGAFAAHDGAGSFVVAWRSNPFTGDADVHAQRFDASGSPRGTQFQVNTYTTAVQSATSVASDPVGNFVVAWWSDGQDGDDLGVYAQRFGGLLPAALTVDRSASGSSDGNLVLEPGESVDVRPSWRNVNGAAQTFDGSALGFDGPAASGVSYLLEDAIGGYGVVPNDATAPCLDCYQVRVGFGGTRPEVHWDATLDERLTPDALGQTKAWSLHLGESFSDVPKASPYYRFVETLLHRSVTGGCTSDAYCPASPVTREQLSVFVLVGKEGRRYAPPACGAPVFGDVPASSPFCRWIEELARRGVVSGCGGGNYCPANPVTREQMPVFVLAVLDPALDPPACGTPMFGDVPASSPYCRWIEELARRGVVSGCGGGNYCPANPVTREQMAVFISATFGLVLYGP